MRTCSKCGASAGNLVRTFERGLGGRVKTFSCRVCGNIMDEQISRPKPKRKSKSKFGKSKTCTACLSRPPVKHLAGLCEQCGATLNKWEQGDRTSPAPFVKVFGTWIKP